MAPPLKICYASAEIAPFAKTGGLADVGAALPRRLAMRGQDIRPFMPLYSSVDRAQRDFRPVEFIRDVTMRSDWRTYAFSLWTAPLSDDGPPGYFVECPELFDRPQIYTRDADEPLRFALFSRAVIESCQRMGWAPDVMHCNDWHTGLIPLLLRSLYEWDRLFERTRSLVTIHNIGYPGTFGPHVIGDLGLTPWVHLFDQEELRAGRVGFLRSGLLYADLISTVSPTYAREIQTPQFGMGLDDVLRARRDRLVGVLNGVDYAEWSPEADPWIPHRFSVQRLAGKRKNKQYLLGQLGLDGDLEAPLLGVISRLVPQKGFDLCFPVLPEALAHSDLRLAVLGSGDRRYEEFFAGLQQRFPGRAVFYRGYHNELAHLIEAGADMFLMPSRYEPCGLNQMFSLRYGTIPIVRRTGGLADSVEPFDPATGEGTGIVFEHFDSPSLGRALRLALELFRQPRLWRRMMSNAMRQDHGWDQRVDRYLELYAWLAGR